MSRRFNRGQYHYEMNAGYPPYDPLSAHQGSEGRSQSYSQYSSYSERRHDQYNAFSESYCGGSSDPPMSHSSAFGSENVRVLTGSPPPEVKQKEQRAPSPSPPPQPPSPQYLALANEPVRRLSSAEDARKLLVLDLNGTLCVRAVHRPFKPRASDLDEHGRPLPRVRPVHPRPYMGTFRSYIFSEATKSWLDVMVWSSARPHSVESMVDVCFEDDKEHLTAIWARDTLGLSERKYHAKVQTIKDLAKPWAKLPPLAVLKTRVPESADASAQDSATTNSSSASEGSTSSDKPKRRQRKRVAIRQEQVSHSAMTTLLLDDSPLKAILQPYNHVCICEYSAQLRAHDLASLTKERVLEEAHARLDPSMDPSADKIEENDAPAASSTCVNEEENVQGPHPDKKRKRKEKKLQKLQDALAQPPEESPYDETLLAVVGVLDEIKMQANVAAWIRAGGLWGPAGPPSTRADKADQLDEVSDKADSEASSSGEHGDVRLSKMERVNPEDADVTMPRKKRKLRWRNGAKQVEPPADDTAPALAGNDEMTVARASPAPPSPVLGDNARPPESQDKIHLWFEDAVTLKYWVKRGREALDDQGIAIEHGMTR